MGLISRPQYTNIGSSLSPERTLPGVRKEIEGSINSLILEDATSETATEDLRHHRFAHFACLVVWSCLPVAEFVLLSACHTAELTDGSIGDGGYR